MPAGQFTGPKELDEENVDPDYEDPDGSEKDEPEENVDPVCIHVPSP